MREDRCGRVLSIGVYLLNARNTASEVAANLATSNDWSVDQRWAAMGTGATPAALETITAIQLRERTPKFVVLNRLLQGVDLEVYDYVLVCDDDIELPSGFLDDYLGLTERYALSLAQPARTHDSFIDHYFVARLHGVEARLTRFVEIGPVFSVRKDAAPLILPFDETAPMGWGLDFVWPVLIEGAGKRMGIVDAISVRHALRKPVSHYDWDKADAEMSRFLAANAHLAHHDAFVAVQTWPSGSVP